jgi:hypothetical protein
MAGRLKTKNYTERALAGATIPSFCYVPRGLRPGVGKINVAITNAEIIDNHARIAEADPLGWIIAVMNGQPIPQFSVEQGELVLTYYIPQIEERHDAAKWLGQRVTFKAPSAYKNSPISATVQHANAYDAMIEQRAQNEE